MKFYDKKIDEIKGLSNKLGKYEPAEQLKQISQKLSLSEGTSKLLHKAMSKKKWVIVVFRFVETINRMLTVDL